MNRNGDRRRQSAREEGKEDRIMGGKREREKENTGSKGP